MQSTTRGGRYYDQGTMDAVRLIDIRETPLSIDEVFAAISDPSAGGTCLFIGTVRDHDGGQGVQSLDYSHHPSARERLREVAQEVAATSGATAVAAVHRVGALAIGDLAVVVGASASHRAQAFEAARQLIDTLKLQVPVWKHQMFDSGESQWVHHA
jgi:molybdopterin synthase catalytic subunit